jgi:hypothetical protein
MPESPVSSHLSAVLHRAISQPKFSNPSRDCQTQHDDHMATVDKGRRDAGLPCAEDGLSPSTMNLVKALNEGDVERVAREKKEGPELSIFQFRDHGAMLRIAGKARNALQYDIGNPITASRMTTYRLAAALYPPIRVVLYENDAGHGVFEYDQPSTTLGQFGDERVTAVARGLDAALTRALTRAAE